ncbi:MAG: GNAT family N-acetyltransferase [Oscillospiraceae bacterium]|nr:GNAT family N-acetyltransferase [Oscillospiraceae bacterium]
MELLTLNESEIDNVYLSRMKQDFPPDELKPLDTIFRALRCGQYRCIGLSDGEKLLGYAYFIILRYDNCITLLLDYFAVDAALRGHGIGTAFLQKLPELFPDADTVLIEVERPDAAETDLERAYRSRRKSFYLRGGCRETGLKARIFGVPYDILQYPLAAEPDTDALRERYDACYRQILTKQLYLANIEIET